MRYNSIICYYLEYNLIRVLNKVNDSGKLTEYLLIVVVDLIINDGGIYAT